MKTEKSGFFIVLCKMTALVNLYDPVWQKIGQPIVERYNEAAERPKAFEELGRQIQLFMKIVDAFKAKVTQHRDC